MLEQIGDGVGVEAEVDRVEDGAGHGDGEMELAHGGDVGRDDGDDVAASDAEGDDGGGQLEAPGMSLGPRANCIIVENCRAVAVDNSSSF